MTWRDLRLGDVLTLQRGHDLPNGQREDGDVPVVSSSGITGSHNEVKATAPGVVTGRYGTIGEVFYLEQDYWPLNTALYVTDFKGNQPRFAAYLLRNTLRNYKSDKAAVPGVNRNVLHEIKVRCPDRVTQERITSILSAYDDQLENNRRRIQLLEQSAQLLFKEWFVHLRFPGHEHVKIKDGVPEGWSLRELADLCVDGDGIQTGPFGSQLHQSDYTEDGVPVVMPRELAGNRISTEGIARVPEEVVNRLSRHKLRIGDTVYGRRGDIGRRAFIGHRENGWICGTGCLRLRPNSLKVAPRYLFDALGSPQTEGTIIARAKGATMPNLNASIMKSIFVLIPSRSLQDIYVDIVNPTENALTNLGAQNERLCKARDLLLPRLMNGEVVV